VLSGLSGRRRAHLPADHKLVENAGWDRAALTLELKELAPLFADAGADIHLAGLDPAEIDALMGGLIDPEGDPADDLPDICKRPISRKDDSWLLGRHRLRTRYQRSAHET